jgi:hypothetical protein
MGSLALWCDGGEESAENRALSGIVGAQNSQPFQSGRGSWVKTIGLPYPFNSQRQTLYNRMGSTGSLVMFWAVAAAFPGSSKLARLTGRLWGKRSGSHSAAASLWRWTKSVVQQNSPHQQDLLS